MAFASPELLLGRDVLGEQTDIWSAGMCLYFALSGGSTLARGKKFTSVTSFGKYLARASRKERRDWIISIGLPARFLVAQVLWGCLNPDPTQRPDAMLLLEHPWVSPDEHEVWPHNRRAQSGPTDGTTKLKPHVDARSRAERSQRLCAHGLDFEQSSAGLGYSATASDHLQAQPHIMQHFNTVDLADFTSTTTPDEDDEGTDFFCCEEKENWLDL